MGTNVAPYGPMFYLKYSTERTDTFTLYFSLNFVFNKNIIVHMYVYKMTTYQCITSKVLI